MAIFGAIALGALGFLIRVGMKMNHDQEIRMAAFRRALVAARFDNGTDGDALGTLYYYVSDRQSPDPNDGFMSLPRVRTQASGFVEWGDRFTFAHGDRMVNQDRGRKTRLLAIARVNTTESKFLRADDFPETADGWTDESCLACVKVAFRGIMAKSSLTNTTSGTITQNAANTKATSSNQAGSSVTLNTKTPVTVGSSLSTGASANW